MKIIWVVVNCNSAKEAKIIGRKILQKRYSSCFDIIKRELTQFFWPPKTGNIDSAKGAILILETFQKYFKKIEKEVRRLHSDKLPFIGSIEINNVRPQFVQWMKDELL